jgi:hypothetical protein
MKTARVGALAATKTKELNLPWDQTAVTLGRPPLGCLTGVVHISSRIIGDNATVTFAVRESTGEVWPLRAVYPGPHRGVDWAFLARRVLWGIGCGVAAFWVATTWANMQASLAGLGAIVIAVGAALASIRLEPTLGA